MAPLPANDVYTWVPPTPAAVESETGFVAAAANVGAFAPSYTRGWTVQTYLSYAANITQTYDIEAPTEKPKRTRTKVEK